MTTHIPASADPLRTKQRPGRLTSSAARMAWTKDTPVPLGLPGHAELADPDVTATIDFFSVWSPDADAHLAVIGRAGSGKSIASRFIADHVNRHLSGTVMTTAPIVNLNPLQGIEGVHTAGPEQAAAMLQTVLAQLDARYTALEKPKRRRTPLTPLVVVIDDYESLHQLADSEQSRQISNAVGAILRLGRSVRIHLIVTGTTPLFPFGDLRNNVAYLAVQTLNPDDARILGNPCPHLSGSRQLELPVGSASFLSPRLRGPMPMRFNRSLHNLLT